ncbi:hypothetical protein N9Z65_00005, partial [bacterium]|nr:hypothetical protein [bacterium]
FVFKPSTGGVSTTFTDTASAITAGAIPVSFTGGLTDTFIYTSVDTDTFTFTPGRWTVRRSANCTSVRMGRG